MIKLIEEQLKKCKVARLPVYSANSTLFFIPKGKREDSQNVNELMVGGQYTIIVEDYIVHPFDGFDLHTQWNGGKVPTDNCMNIEVLEVMGKMVKVHSCGVNDRSIWIGWLPSKSIISINSL